MAQHPKVDWKEAIRGMHDGPQGTVVYLGRQTTDEHGQPITDGYHHLVLLGKARSVLYVNDYGEIMRKNGSPQRMIRNEVEEEIPEPVRPPSLSTVGAASGPGAGALIRALDNATLAFKACAVTLERIQAEAFAANTLVLEELRKIKEGQPAIAAAVRTPEVVVKKAPQPVAAAAEAEPPVVTSLDAPKVQRLDVVHSKAARSRLVALSQHVAVAQIVVGNSRPIKTGAYIEGLIEAGSSFDRGFRAKLFGRDESYDIDIYVTDAAKTAVVRAGLAFRAGT